MGLTKLKGILDDAIYEQLLTRFTNLNRFAKVYFDFFIKESNQIIINVSQYEKLTDEIYSEKDLVALTKSFVDIIENEGFTVHINARPYSGDELSLISASWVKEKMAEHDISQRSLAKSLGVDEFIISKLLSNRIGFTRWHKATFFYYFQGKGI
ncbi:MAG TPA: hypothetical protein PKD85_07245 [Saprospiraceae bacterium]|nr:hypothetical protein [Saprospiraceae bacterium]